jgi:putative PIN family toxin of toxin-antitoxin system
MADERWQVFLDTNVLISGLFSQTGASSAILDLGEAEEIVVVLSAQVLVEADRVFSAKFPQILEGYRRFIKNLAPHLVEDPQPKVVANAQKIIEADDAPILAAVKESGVDYLVTLNTRHFHTPKVRAYLPCPILTPAEFITVFRKTWEK